MKPRTLVLFFLALAIFLNGNAQISDTSASNKYNISKYSKMDIGGIYSNVSVENGESEIVYALGFRNEFLIRPSQHFAYGIGGGIKIYEKQIFIPISVDLLICSPKNLYVNLQPGWSFGWKRKSGYYPNQQLAGGYTTTFGIGYKIKTKGEYNSCIELSYNYQNSRLKSDSQLESKMNFHSIMLTLGLVLERK